MFGKTKKQPATEATEPVSDKELLRESIDTYVRTSVSIEAESRTFLNSLRQDSNALAKAASSIRRFDLQWKGLPPLGNSVSLSVLKFTEAWMWLQPLGKRITDSIDDKKAHTFTQNGRPIPKEVVKLVSESGFAEGLITSLQSNDKYALDLLLEVINTCYWTGCREQINTLLLHAESQVDKGKEKQPSLPDIQGRWHDLVERAKNIATAESLALRFVPPLVELAARLTLPALVEKGTFLDKCLVYRLPESTTKLLDRMVQTHSGFLGSFKADETKWEWKGLTGYPGMLSLRKGEYFQSTLDLLTNGGSTDHGDRVREHIRKGEVLDQIESWGAKSSREQKGLKAHEKEVPVDSKDSLSSRLDNVQLKSDSLSPSRSSAGSSGGSSGNSSGSRQDKGKGKESVLGRFLGRRGKNNKASQEPPAPQASIQSFVEMVKYLGHKYRDQPDLTKILSEFVEWNDRSGWSDPTNDSDVIVTSETQSDIIPALTIHTPSGSRITPSESQITPSESQNPVVERDFDPPPAYRP
ncbi:hypothetical protein M231_06917 [Tremella mesenterica]|uniref:Uncharacterized protein n=1 Tax=Tremella mesenterica TaxID=5217 RepID=A0A4Q1BG38_TREME|nr:hypothetical protein M231_06917 [Tremella mesenterica]